MMMVVVSGKLSTFNIQFSTSHLCMALVRAEKSGGPTTGSNPGTGGAGIKAGVAGTAGDSAAGWWAAVMMLA